MDFGSSLLLLPDGKCGNDPNDITLKIDCTAHSVKYDVATNTFRALMVLTNVWCSSGIVTPNDNLVQTGGSNDDERVARVFSSYDSCNWQEISNGLTIKRWYARDHILSDGRQIVVSGRQKFNCEFVHKDSTGNTFSLSFLSKSNNRDVKNLKYIIFAI
ncbi:hypothetical protein PTKIN_Ptkin11bG0008200 [Pterospermum kingtungense]